MTLEEAKKKLTDYINDAQKHDEDALMRAVLDEAEGYIDACEEFEDLYATVSHVEDRVKDYLNQCMGDLEEILADAGLETFGGCIHNHDHSSNGGRDCVFHD